MDVSASDLSVATKFVAMMLKYGKAWRITKDTLPTPEEFEAIREVVAAAGFEPREIIFGKLFGDYLDQDGSVTGEKYAINAFSQLTVIGQDGKPHDFATGWLDCAFLHAQRFLANGEERIQVISKSLAEEIARSRPRAPIRLTEDNDTLIESPPSEYGGSRGYFVDHVREEHVLREGVVGIHECCKGFIDRQQATRSHDILLCRRCRLRLPFPNAVKTYGELRAFMTKKLGT